MSHAPERTEKNCLNCGTIVMGRYCQNCGQENVIPKESFGKLVLHFFYDITHFDSKFFYSLKYLLFRPGLLSKEYIRGRRAKYLNPVRMYVFTSAVFFLIFFNLKGTNTNVSMKLTNQDRINLANDLKKRLAENPADSSLQKKITTLQDTTKPLPFQIGLFSDATYSSLHEYDSVQSSLPQDKRDGWLEKLLITKSIQVNEKHRGNPEAVKADFLNIFLHKLPYLLFLSLPVFAAILKLLYIRRKAFYYSDHLIFSIHHYIFSFILLLLFFGITALNNWLQWGIFIPISIILFISWPVYLYAEMKNFYGQGIFKTLVKFTLLNLLGFFVILILFVAFLFLSIIQL